MTTDELKQLLEAVANGLETLKSVLPPEVDDEIIDFLNKLDSSTIDLVYSLLHVSHPNMTKEEFVGNIEKIKQMLSTVKMMIQNGRVDELVDKCRRLQNRRMVLAIISKFM